MSPSLAASPLATFTHDELAYMGDGIPRDASGKPLPWAVELLAEQNDLQTRVDRKAEAYVAKQSERHAETIEPPSHELEDGFYDARTWTRHIMQQADWMGMAREALFASALAVMSSRIPPNVKADLTGRDAPMPLNLYVNLSGVTGSGKSRAVSTARTLYPDDDSTLEINPASGEAIASQFVERVRNEGEWETRQKASRALMVCTEISQVSAIASRTGSTLIPQLLHAWSGETLGATTKTKELDTHVRGGAYRFSAIFGVQPANAGIFVSEGVENGFAGRCLYFCTTDTRLDEHARDVPPEGEWEPFKQPDATRPITITYPKRVRDYALSLIREGTKGNVRDVNGHRAEQIGRVAALYALADGRTVVSDEDWTLALLAVERSDAVREWLFARYRLEQVRSEAARVETKLSARDDADARKIERVAERLLRKLRTKVEGFTARQLRQFLGRDGKYFDNAINDLVSSGTVVEVKDLGNLTYHYFIDPDS